MLNEVSSVFSASTIPIGLCLPGCEALDSITSTLKSGMVINTYNPITREVEAGGSEFRSFLAVQSKAKLNRMKP